MAIDITAMIEKEPSTNVIAAGAVVNVARYMKGLRYPATRQDVDRIARRNGADPSALEEIARMPDGAFKDPIAVFDAIGDEVRKLEG
ncbi:MAG: DUF2795 domain-containing protein [Candidatus Thermoplasmatota archaeon]